MSEENKDVELYQRVKGVEIEINSVKKDVHEIRDNHLQHLKLAIERVDTRLWYVLTVICIGFLSSIVMLLLK